MKPNWSLGFWVKCTSLDYSYKKILLEKFFQQCQDKLLTLLKKKSIDVFYE